MSCEDGDKEKAPQKKHEGEFPIRNFPDMRELRKMYLKCGILPIGLDSADNPRPEEAEEDFGLKRSTPEEALEFLRDAVAPEEGGGDGDPLTEFLDDE